MDSRCDCHIFHDVYGEHYWHPAYSKWYIKVITNSFLLHCLIFIIKFEQTYAGTGTFLQTFRPFYMITLYIHIYVSLSAGTPYTYFTRRGINKIAVSSIWVTVNRIPFLTVSTKEEDNFCGPRFFMAWKLSWFHASIFHPVLFWPCFSIIL